MIIALAVIITFLQKNTTTKNAFLNDNKNNKNVSKEAAIPCEYKAVIENFNKQIPSNIDKNDEKYKRVIQSIIDNSSIDKLSIQNDECGANAASWLANIFSNISFKEKASEYHKMVLHFAKQGNRYAIRNICIGADLLATKDNRIQSCEIIFDSSKVNYDNQTKFIGYKLLSSHYFDTDQGTKLIDFCEKNPDRKEVCYYSFAFPSVNRLAEKLYDKKEYKQAIFLYEKSASYDESGKIQALLGFIYFEGLGVKADLNRAISWFEKSLAKKNFDIEAIIINQMGIAYEKQNKYVEAFKYYKKAAYLGLSIGQFNLARQYARGHGAIQDYKEAYAWISVSIAQGLDNKEQQNKAEKFQTWFKELLKEQDKRGLALIEAANLAKNYYQQYVLHKKGRA